MAAKDINPEKLKALQLTMEKLDKAYGKGAVMKLGDSPVEKVEVIPTSAIWFGVTYKEDAPAVRTAIESLLQTGEYPAGLWK